MQQLQPPAVASQPQLQRPAEPQPAPRVVAAQPTERIKSVAYAIIQVRLCVNDWLKLRLYDNPNTT
eukprot:scaffold33996_cov19-Prasinocladus_malaysianus.AAC.1